MVPQCSGDQGTNQKTEVDFVVCKLTVLAAAEYCSDIILVATYLYYYKSKPAAHLLNVGCLVFVAHMTKSLNNFTGA